MMCATHSQPARVLSACWKGAVAVLGELLRKSSGHKTSEEVFDLNPLTPPSGFRNAVMRPMRRALTISCGTSPLANVSALSTIQCLLHSRASGANALLSCPKDQLLRPAGTSQSAGEEI